MARAEVLTENRWAPNADHYPLLKMHGGKLTPWNVRLAHVFCNRQDYGWRSRIHAMLKKKPVRSRISLTL